MNSSELLRLQLAKNLECSRIGYASGPTGPTGSTGLEGPPGPAGNEKTFTFFLDFDSLRLLSRIYIPPGFSTDPKLIVGGVFTEDIPELLVFVGLTEITISSIKYNFPIGLSATGYYNGGFWAPSPYAVLGNASGIRWRNVADIINLNTINILGVNPLNLNGNSLTPKYLYLPGTAIENQPGWLGTLTIYYL